MTATAKALTDYRAQLKQELAQLNKRVAAPSGNKISLKGKVFTLPDGTVSNGPLAAIVLDFRIVRAYYSKPFNAKDITGPDCWAVVTDLEGMEPHEKAKAKQSVDCASCEKNAWGSSPTGKGKSCKDQRRLAIVPANATEDTEPMTLMLSPTAVKHWDNYVNGLIAAGLNPIEVITHFAFDPQSDYPTLRMGKPVDIADEMLPVVFKLREKCQPMLDRSADIEQ
jgi:hypothetical protein